MIHDTLKRGFTNFRPPTAVHLYTFSAATEEELRQRVARFLPDEAGAAGQRPFRLALWASEQEEALAKTAAFLRGDAPQGWLSGQAPETPPPVAFLCTGQGAQYVGMGRALYETEPHFRQALEACAEGLRPYLPIPLPDVLYPPEGQSSPIDETTYTQPALFAIEYALAQLWLAWGVRPAVLLGHSVGEYAAAALAGVFSLADGLKLIAARGRLMGALPTGGSMAAVFADEATVAALLAPYADRVAIAALNGPAQTVISGEETAVAHILDALKKVRVRARPLVVSHAFHSPLMDPMLDEFAQIAATVRYQPPQIPLISNVTGQLAAPELLATAQYWRDHARAAVRFAPAVQTLYEMGIAIFLEIGPQPHLTGMARRIPNERGGELPLLLPSMQQGEDAWQVLMQSWAQLWVLGAADLPPTIANR